MELTRWALLVLYFSLPRALKVLVEPSEVVVLFQNENPTGLSTVDLHYLEHEQTQTLPGAEITQYKPPALGQAHVADDVDGDLCRRCDSTADENGSGLCRRCQLSDAEGSVPPTIDELNIGDHVKVAGYQSTGMYVNLIVMYGLVPCFLPALCLSPARTLAAAVQASVLVSVSGSAAVAVRSCAVDAAAAACVLPSHRLSPPFFLCLGGGYTGG